MRKETGRRGEELAALYLSRLGFEIVERNYRCRWGEIDIICRRGNLMVFVEVRSKSTERFGTPEETINRTKVSRIRRTAMEYLREKAAGRPFNMRFDLIAITFQKGQGNIKHIKGAFECRMKKCHSRG